MKKLLRYLKKSTTKSHYRPAFFIISFAIVGAILIIVSRAATPNASLEAENGTLSNPNLKISGDSTASGGSYVQFGAGSGSSGGVSDATLNALITSVPSSTTGPAPSGPTVGEAGQFDTSTLATNEVWDNFDGSTLDSRLWQRDTINQGGTQIYQDANTTLDGSGHAVMIATQSGGNIYSGRFTSRQKFAMKYGWTAARIKMPSSGNGVGGAWFPAFWLLLTGYNTSPNYAEFDIIEQFGNSSAYATNLHYGGTTSLNNDIIGVDANQGYRTYWMLWEADRIRAGVDANIIGDWKPTDLPQGLWAAHFQQPMYFITNFAVAPPWLPAPKSTDFPAQMSVDWEWYKPLTNL